MSKHKILIMLALCLIATISFAHEGNDLVERLITRASSTSHHNDMTRTNRLIFEAAARISFLEQRIVYLETKIDR